MNWILAAGLVVAALATAQPALADHVRISFERPPDDAAVGLLIAGKGKTVSRASAERVLSLVEAVPEIRDSERVAARMRERGDDGHPDRLGRIEFQRVGFRYREGPQIIEAFDILVEAGETIALVGATGGGKSTIVNLLCRFYEPTEGRILIDGVDYRDRSLEWLQSRFCPSAAIDNGTGAAGRIRVNAPALGSAESLAAS